MEEGFTNFLLDKENDFILYKKDEDGNYYLRKENIGEDDRFQLIYYKSLDKKRLEVEYSVAGIYDTKETTIYNLCYPFMNIIPANSKIHSADFGTVEYEMMQKLNKNLNQYLIEHKDSIKKYGLNGYKELQNYQIQSLKRETEKVFITNSNPKIEYNFDVTTYTLYETLNSERSFEILKYLREPEQYVNNLVGKIVEKKKEEYGLYILKNNDKEKYLIELSKNKSGKYNDIYLNKTIYDSIKYTYARTLNITIESGAFILFYLILSVFSSGPRKKIQNFH